MRELRDRRDAIERVAAHHGARIVRVFGSVARGDVTVQSDLDLIVDMQQQGLFAQAALQTDLEDVLGCPVHTITTTGLRYMRPSARAQIENDAISL
jgi:predicted nucleotidyltransferase